MTPSPEQVIAISYKNKNAKLNQCVPFKFDANYMAYLTKIEAESVNMMQQDVEPNVIEAELKRIACLQNGALSQYYFAALATKLSKSYFDAQYTMRFGLPVSEIRVTVLRRTTY